MGKARFRQLKDKLAERLMGGLTVFAATLVLLIALALLTRAQPLLDIKPLGELLTSSDWHPLRGEFGFWPFIAGTLWVTALAMTLAVPPCLLCAIYLAEYAPRRLREMLKPLIDLLAGIPSVVYGLWGTLMVVPITRDVITPWAASHLGAIPLLALIANNYGEMMSIPLYDAALLAAALVLLLIVLIFTLVARVVLLQAVRRTA